LLNQDGANKTPLLDDHRLHLSLTVCPGSPDLIYDTWNNGTLDLWRSEADGSNPRRLTASPTVGTLTCLPGSRRVMYIEDGAFWSTSIDGGAPKKEMDLPFAQLGLSPDGKLLFYVSRKVEAGTIHPALTLAPAAGKPPLRSFEAPFGFRLPQFTPDSKAIAYLLTRDRATNIWKQALTGGDPVPMTRFTGNDMFSFAWSEDGKQLAFSRGERKTDVVMMTNLR
jgi:Tol biopolymer transport system component